MKKGLQKNGIIVPVSNLSFTNGAKNGKSLDKPKQRKIIITPENIR
jgi:hypothetical protein